MDTWGSFKEAFTYTLRGWTGKFASGLSHLNSTNNIPLGEHAAFGVVLKLDKTTLSPNTKKVIFKVRWTTPFVEEGKVIHQQKTIDSIEDFWIEKGKARIVYSLNDDWEQVEAQWRLEVYTLDDKKGFDKIFHTQK